MKKNLQHFDSVEFLNGSGYIVHIFSFDFHLVSKSFHLISRILFSMQISFQMSAKKCIKKKT